MEERNQLYKKKCCINWNYFAEVFRSLVTDLAKLLNHKTENNYVKISNIMTNAAKNIDLLTTGLIILHNYFDVS